MALRCFGLQNNNSYYYVLTNIQGDVLGIYNPAGELVASYEYDTWGNLINMTDTSGVNIGTINPIRYRGYYFDEDTGLYYLQSRYYDPQVGRFINADGVTDGGAGIKGVNLDLYSANNPILYLDPTGKWIIKDAIKKIAKKYMKPGIYAAKKAFAAIGGTLSIGLNVSFSPSFWNYNLQGAVSIDQEGNTALQGTYASGLTGGSPAISITAYETTTNAPNIEKLTGLGYQIGVSAGAGLLAGFHEHTLIQDIDENKWYFGTSNGLGIGSPGAEVHIEMSDTRTWQSSKYNVFDAANYFYIKIMEW